MASHQPKTHKKPNSEHKSIHADTRPQFTQPNPLNQVQMKPENIIRLQALIGNQAVQRMFASSLMVTSTAHQARIAGEVLRLVEDGNSRMPYEYVKGKLDATATNNTLQEAYKRAIQAIIEAEADQQDSVVISQAMSILKLIERQFIHDADASTLDLLPDGKGEKFRNFKWDDNDYPGDSKFKKDGTLNPRKGDHEFKATQMAHALSQLFPPQRANSGDNAVVSEDEFEGSKAIREYIKNQLATVPGQGLRLNQTAAESFVAMREAALADGVELHLLAAYRNPKTSKKNAKRVDNNAAVADFSSHNLGLAFDVRMRHGEQKFGKEVSTGKMPKVVEMRESAVHKWLFLNADQYGWYPYQNEPWHWEYNPPGFREQLHENAKEYWKAQELSK